MTKLYSEFFNYEIKLKIGTRNKESACRQSGRLGLEQVEGA